MPTDLEQERELLRAERDAEICGIGYLVDGVRVSPERVRVFYRDRAALAAPAAPQEQPSDITKQAAEALRHLSSHLGWADQDAYSKLADALEGERLAAPQAQPSDEEIEHIGYECGLRKSVEHWGVRYHFELGRNLFEFARALLSRYGAAPQGREDVQPVAWRHSKTMCLYETEEEVPLADGDEWAEPLYVTPQPAPEAAPAEELAAARQEIERLNSIINTPQADDFLRAVSTEAEHQRQRWGSEHDAGKAPADWFWLLGYLGGKALHAHSNDNMEKAEHHIITTAAVCANWHRAMFGKTDMRPGIDGEAALTTQGASHG